ncbi:MAG: hypothetical protein RJA70_3115 [Pseudomonadota bacterium]
MQYGQLLSAAELEALQRATDALEQAASELVRDTRIHGVFFELQSLTGQKGQGAVFPGALRKITSPSKGQPAFAKLRQHPRVIELLRACGLPEPRCFIDQVNFKLPHVGTRFPYHQDENFLFGEALSSVQSFGGLNLVIALDAADEGNGGFEVLGRTHDSGLVNVPYDMNKMNNAGFDESHRASPALMPGDAVLFHPRLAHGSGPNRSDRRRRLITLWYGGGPSDALGGSVGSCECR